MRITTIDRRPVKPRVLGSLTMRTGQMPRGHFSSASGIVAIGSGAWVVGDDLSRIATFDALGAPGRLASALQPASKKPDLEAITDVGALPALPNGFIFAVPSGSTNERRRAVAWVKDAAGHPGAPRVIDLAPLHARLAAAINGNLNIEGMAFRTGAHGPELLLFQRAQRPGDPSAVFLLDAAAVARQIASRGSVDGDVLRQVHAVDLGELDGMPLGFADARALPDGSIAFLASAERGSSTSDGAILGSAIGLLDASFGVRALRMLDGPARKTEGLELASAFDARAGAREFIVVTDPDDPGAASEVLSVDLG